MNMTIGLTLGQVFSRAMALCRADFGRLFAGIVLPLGVASGLMSAGMAALQSRLVTNPLYLMAALFPLVLVVIAVSIVGVGALSHAAIELTAGRTTPTSVSWRQGLRFKVWGTLLLSGIGVGLGLVCCLLPGMYLALVWSLALPVVFEESIYHSRALSRSNQLASFNPQGDIGNDPRFRMFLVYAVTLVTTYILSFMVQLPLMIVTFTVVARQVASGAAPVLPMMIQWLQVPTTIASSLIQSSLALLANFAAAVIFFDIKGRQEATDIATAIDELAAKPNA